MRVLVERINTSKSEASAVFSAEAVKLAVRECPSLRLQQKPLELLLDSGDEMAKYTTPPLKTTPLLCIKLGYCHRYIVMSRALMSEKYDNLSQQHNFLQMNHENLLTRYHVIVSQGVALCVRLSY